MSGHENRWELDDGDTGEAILPVLPISPGAVSIQWMPEPHVHVWVRRQNVTTKGTVMPPYESCVCGAARPVLLDVDFVGSEGQYAVVRPATEAARAKAEAALADWRRGHRPHEWERVADDLAAALQLLLEGSD